MRPSNIAHIIVATQCNLSLSWVSSDADLPSFLPNHYPLAKQACTKAQERCFRPLPALCVTSRNVQKNIYTGAGSISLDFTSPSVRRLAKGNTICGSHPPFLVFFVGGTLLEKKGWVGCMQSAMFLHAQNLFALEPNSHVVQLRTRGSKQILPRPYSYVRPCPNPTQSSPLLGDSCCRNRLGPDLRTGPPPPSGVNCPTVPHQKRCSPPFVDKQCRQFRLESPN